MSRSRGWGARRTRSTRAAVWRDSRVTPFVCSGAWQGWVEVRDLTLLQYAHDMGGVFERSGVRRVGREEHEVGAGADRDAPAVGVPEERGAACGGGEQSGDRSDPGTDERRDLDQVRAVLLGRGEVRADGQRQTLPVRET